MIIERMSSWTKDTWTHGMKFVQDKKKKGKVAFGILAGSLLASGTAAGGYVYQSNLTTLYHVSVDGKEIGVVNNLDVIRKWLGDKLAAEKKKYPNLALGFQNDIMITEKQHYNGQGVRSSDILKKLAPIVHVEANAAQLVVNGQTIAYAKDQKTINEALYRLKASYNEKKPMHNLTAGVENVAAGQAKQSVSGISHITIKEKIQVEKKSVAPGQVLDEVQLMNVLQKGVPEQKKHIVQDGENLWNIAPQYGLKEKELLAMNPGLKEGTLLQVGDKINVQALAPKITIVSKQETIENVVIPYKINAKPEPKKYRGDDTIVTEGKNGSKQVVYELVKENGKLVQKNPIQQKIIQQPVAKVIIRGTRVKPSRGDGHFRMPSTGIFSSPFGERWGRMHAGIDIATPIGTPVYTSDNGRVAFVGTKSGYGKVMMVDHGNGYRTLYGHLDGFVAKPGDIVVKGEVIAKSGNTGRSTGPHLHFEIHKDGEPVNPMTYLR
ncbi:M23 family metallopeptidase [Aneurinibacillus aneurinilyticus]|jgi:murein DD-endopeptidase MepM/ murein hydrolase activator NlpD|uniref:M23 family metallopeptidase n=1 Tax=Aneurinibacillus aneurinilyticus TaxID=1391 RepID=UPI0023F8A8B6|nr:M23 family metallopeptidase [Aneurinibacillus aneurinilyticus]MCI1693413.1 peptidoglycan DD-metalloendopeptidase family protein [Aneurinibacillus aneurinilyticus]